MDTIRLAKTNSVYSVNEQNFLDVELKSTSKLYHFTDIKEVVDHYEQFTKERDACNKYRLILTINPFCTNVLFNALTEIVYKEGSADVENVYDTIEGEGNNSSTYSAKNAKNAYGIKSPSGTNSLTRLYMIRNSEYSRYGIGEDRNECYVYHPGYDFFNNHLLRNKSFKIVNKADGNTDYFNTIMDKMRYSDTKQVQFMKRNSLEEDAKQMERHLYLADDIMSFEECIDNNLVEENGWYGFVNSSNIKSFDMKNEFSDMGISLALNNHKPCEFIDMYPDRTLYSFVPKYNKYRHRIEYNWDIILTYPYKKINDNEIVGVDMGDDFGGIVSSLVILTIEKKYSPSDETSMVFRTLTKHGLKRGDFILVYYCDKENEENGDETEKWHVYEKEVMIKDVGDLNKDDKEYCFYITDIDFIDTFTGYSREGNQVTEFIRNYKYRFARIVNGHTCEYYIRKFRKLPNFKFRKENFSWDNYTEDDDSVEPENNDSLERYMKYVNDYIDNNSKRGEKTVLFDNEQYKLGFASTIYGDDAVQLTFTDTIDVDNLMDEFGRPVTEIYATIIKTNRGHKEWYEDNDPKSPNVEFSHCFGKVSCGLQYSQGLNDLSVNVMGEEDMSVRKYRGMMGDISSTYYQYDADGEHFFPSDEGENDFIFDYDITVDKNDDFYGDIIEFVPDRVETRVLQPFMFRFNTKQREFLSGGVYNNSISYDEITADDYDYKEGEDTSFKVETYTVTNDTTKFKTFATFRPEGYCYIPHYRIPIKEFSGVNQESHYDITLSDITVTQSDGIFLRLVSVRDMHVLVGDTIYLCDDKENKLYEFSVTYIENRVTYYVAPKSPLGKLPWPYFREKSKGLTSKGLTWIDVVEKTITRKNNGNDSENDDDKPYLVFRKKNDNIPYYALKVGKNTYLWRDALKPGDKNIVNLPEYEYANNAFYISNSINFFLKRQDPKGWNDLYGNGQRTFPMDVSGNIKPESKYNYKQEKEVVC